MATIIDNTPWTSQPQQAVGIDWSNPITRGLVIAENHSNPRLAAFNSPTKKIGASYRGTGGVATRFVSASSQYLKQSNTSLTNYPLTFLSVFQRASRPFDGVLIGIGAGTNRQILYVNQDNIACFSGAGATTAQAVSTNTELSIYGPGDVSCAVGVVSAANSRSVYLDGVLVGSNSTTVSTGASNTAVIGCYWNNDAPSTYFNGDIYLSLAWNRSLSDAEVKSLSQNPWQIFKPLPRRIFVPAPTAGGLYTLTAQSGSYAVSGQQATLLRHRNLTASSGTYNITGQSVNITYSPTAAVYTLTAQAGSYTLTGIAATLLKSKLLSTSSGSYSTTGNSATISKNRVLTATSGSYTITGRSATLTYVPLTPVYTLTAQTGVYNITGQTAQLLRHRLLTTSAGSYVYTGQSITINKYTSGTSNLVKYVNVLTGEVLILKQLGV